MPASTIDGFESELLIGLVAAVGTDLRLVTDALKDTLELAGYTVQTVKVSKDIIPLLIRVDNFGKDNFKRISALMTAGNQARKDSDNNAALALGIATEIGTRRELSENAPGKLPLAKTAIIFDSLKRPEEVEELRRIYPSGFILVGIHAEESQRLYHLSHDRGMTVEQAKELVARDSDESKDEYGQRVNKTFHLADFFVRNADSSGKLKSDINRMVELWFGNPFITPTFEEHAMFMAFSAALRSADLSRQVGAVIARDSQILAMGPNDCPKAKGGLYCAERLEGGRIGDIPGGRDHTCPDGDSNTAEQIRIIDRIVSEGKKEGFDEDKLRKLLEESSIKDLTEYGRVVHAEMEALLSCARCGLLTKGATLYSTTFPCHNCAKHIIAAGIVRVVYVEPYPKSKTLEFHKDAITTDLVLTKETEGLVQFVPFVGIGPRRFFDLFSMRLGTGYPLERKDSKTGKKKEWAIGKALLRIQMNPASYLELEAEASTRFAEIVATKSKGDGK